MVPFEEFYKDYCKNPTKYPHVSKVPGYNNWWEWIDKKEQQHIKKGYTKSSFMLSDKEVYEEDGVAGFLFLRHLERMGFVYSVLGHPEKQLSLRGKIQNLFSKINQKTK